MKIDHDFDIPVSQMTRITMDAPPRFVKFALPWGRRIGSMGRGSLFPSPESHALGAGIPMPQHMVYTDRSPVQHPSRRAPLIVGDTIAALIAVWVVFAFRLGEMWSEVAWLFPLSVAAVIPTFAQPPQGVVDRGMGWRSLPVRPAEGV